MHMKGIDARDEVEGEEGNGEDGDKAIDAGALVGGEKLEVFDGGISKEHGEIEGNYCIENIVKLLWRHLFGSLKKNSLCTSFYSLVKAFTFNLLIVMKERRVTGDSAVSH